jgi:Zn-dependent protease
VSQPTSGDSSPAARLCANCGSELAQLALVCPNCQTLVHAAKLKELAARAAQLDSAGQLEQARAAWDEALELLPYDSKQAQIIVERLKDFELRISAASGSKKSDKKPATEHGSWWKQGGAGLLALVLLLAGKGKFLLLGLTKLKTFVSMFAFFGVYWNVFGWPLALGFVVGIYIHEMGHVFALRKHGIASESPLFIPGVGAVIMAKRAIQNPIIDAEVGLAGPIYGLGAGLVALGIAWWTGHSTWLAIAQLTGLINLFNLMPVWTLDGSRGFHALDGPMRWGIVAACGLAFWIFGSKLLLLVGGVAVWRAFKAEQDKGDVRTFLTFLGLIASLSWMASLTVLP